MVAGRIEFNPTDQGEIAQAAAALFSRIEADLPRVPWLSHMGQQRAFLDTARLIGKKVEEVPADPNARKAMIFWELAIVYANKKSFRLAVQSVKKPKWSPVFLSKLEQSFIDWIGQEIHPGIVVRRSIAEW